MLWGRLCWDPGRTWAGQGTLTAARAHWGPRRAWWAAPGSRECAGHTPGRHCGLCAWHRGTLCSTSSPPSLRAEEQPLVKPKLCKLQTCKILCSLSQRLEAGGLTSNICSMLSKVCRVCKKDKMLWQAFSGPSQL